MLPVGSTAAPDAAALAWLPGVGIVVGALAGSLGFLTSRVAPAPLPAAVAFGASLAVTGALHLDGFLDSCDGLLASVAPARRIEIMRDPHHGTYAVAGFAVVATLWLGALAAVPARTLPAALAFAGGAARLGALLNAYGLPYRADGASVAAFRTPPPRAPLAAAAATLTALALAQRTPRWLAAGAGACALSWGLGRLAARRLDGALSGDVYGALIVTGEVAVLCVLAGAQGH